MLGNLYISTNININENIISIDISIDEQNTFTFNGFKEVNILYLKIKGKFNGLLTILNSNQINILDINYSYYFSDIKLTEQDYLSFKIQKSDKNKILNLILYNDTCSALKIYKNNEVIACNNKLNNYYILNSNNDYILEFYPNIGYSLTINFLYNIISDIDNSKNIQASNYFDFLFIMNIKNFNVNETIGFFVDSQKRFSIKGGFIEENIDRNQLIDESIFASELIKKEELKYFIINKEKASFNYFLFGIKIYTNKGDYFSIKKIDSVIQINNSLFQYQLKEDKSYLFIISKNFLGKYIDSEYIILLSYEKDNKMNTIIYDDRIYNNKLLFFNLKQIEGIFFEKREKGLFEFKMMDQSFKLSLKKDYTSIFYSSSEYISSFLPNFNDYFFYYGVIAGDINFSLFEKIENENKIIKHQYL